MASPQPSSSFTLFPTLLTEIRLKIWQFVLPGPRTLGLEYNTKPTRINGKTLSVFTGWASSQPQPIALSICRESRIEALKRYETAFGSPFHPSRTYINFAIDTVRFENGYGGYYTISSPGDGREPTTPLWIATGPTAYYIDIFLGGGFHGGGDIEKVESMILDIGDEIFDRTSFCFEEIRLFTGLKRLTLIHWSFVEDEDEWRNWIRETVTATSRNHPEWIVPDINTVYAPRGEVVPLEMLRP